MEDFKGDIQIIDGELYMTGNAIDRLHKMKKTIREIAGEELRLFKVDIATDNTLIGVCNVLVGSTDIDDTILAHSNDLVVDESSKGLGEYNIHGGEDIITLEEIGGKKIINKVVPSNSKLNTTNPNLSDKLYFEVEGGVKFTLRRVVMLENNSPIFYLIGTDHTIHIFNDGSFQKTKLTFREGYGIGNNYLQVAKKNTMFELLDALAFKGYLFFNASTISYNRFINISNLNILTYNGVDINNFKRNRETEAIDIYSYNGSVIASFKDTNEAIKELGLE